MDTSDLPVIPPIDDLNGLHRDDFEVAIRPLFEIARPLADGLYARRPFASYEDLLDQAEAVQLDLSAADQIDVINAHPRIGQRAGVSVLSAREQGAAEDEDVHRSLQRLNDAYEARFGFRFVVFVNRRSRREIQAVLEERLRRPAEVERQTALREMIDIARDRLRLIRGSAVG